MDLKTLSAYDTGAAGFAKEWHDQPPPADLHAIVQRFFRPGPTADIGCGSGREVAWLAANGYAATGYDCSDSRWRRRACATRTATSPVPRCRN